MTCNKCGGTGDAYDYSVDDWADPRDDCPFCEGTGEIE